MASKLLLQLMAQHCASPNTGLAPGAFGAQHQMEKETQGAQRGSAGTVQIKTPDCGLKQQSVPYVSLHR